MPVLPTCSGGAITSDTTSLDRVIIWDSVAGQQTYYIPMGSYFKNAASEVQLEVSDHNGPWNVQQFGVDFICRCRAVTVPTVADAAFGVTFIEGSVPIRWKIRITWKERRLLFAPTVVLPVRVDDLYTGWWGEMSPTLFPDGVQVPTLSSEWAIEFWRLTPKPGGTTFINPSTGEVVHHEGRRWIPHWRGAAGDTAFKASTSFGATLLSKRKRFRVCYYNPNTGARSALSSDVVVVGQVNGLSGDWANGVQRRRGGAVWVEQ